ncbi:MAG: LPS export ABC transporter periplasmic protein LptC [Aliidiomarina sp.]|uniref:LPS export ABC transporter periplasmic protein LptC n=1 Tax=Aliidiomarina sp. TaxID=1872439 RepID=UPI0025BA9434|nr:LPS export ABC transporter periplasmic protein LptC [Aliidiomarina sp.]MCH8501251.1 LPS export ABC transporter periplasmic protein LptC [Aliidiomarina sp.]
MNKRSLVLLVLFACVSAGLLWYSFDREEPIVIDSSDSQLIPDFTAFGLSTRVFESDGRLAHQIQAERMAHFSTIRLTELEQPVYTTFLSEHSVNIQETGAVWEISARHGRFFEDERLELIDNVSIVNRSGIGYIEEIRTDYLEIDLQTGIMQTDQAVTLRGPQFNVEGVGMRVNLEAQQLEIINHVETIYYPRHIRP